MCLLLSQGLRLCWPLVATSTAGHTAAFMLLLSARPRPLCSVACCSVPYPLPSGKVRSAQRQAACTNARPRLRSVDATDLYSVSLASSPTSRPAALQTTVETTLAFDDLYPDTDYWLTLRSHPSIEPVAEVWGWRPAAAVLHCRTSTENTAAPHRLRRQGDTPHESELRLEWATAGAGVPRAEAAAGVPRGGTPIAAHSVGIRTQGGLSPWRWAAATAPSTAVLSGLPSGTAWEVTVRDDTTGAVSDPLIMRTAAPGAMHTTAWRISEYTFDVDFLQNHDAAEAKTLPLYIQVQYILLKIVNGCTPLKT